MKILTRNLIIALGIAAAAAPAPMAAQQVTRLSATKANDYGIVYSLPRTALSITLGAEGTVSTPGEFYQYAERYLGPQAARQAIARPSSTWKLTSASITPVGVPDTAGDTWLMQFKSGSSAFLMVDEAGLPLAIGTDNVEAPAPVASDSASPRRPDRSATERTAARYAMTEDMVQSSSIGKRAALAAAQIMELRRSRQDYLTGQADAMPDGAALKLILENINAQEEALTAMFLGTVRKDSQTVTLTFTPTDGPESDRVIARLSPTAGFVDADDLSGAPVYLNLTVTDRGKMPVNEKGETKKFPKNGIAYCIPGSADVAIDFDGRTFCSRSVNLAQLGLVYGLDPSIFTDKKAPAYVIFDPTTGGIRELGTK